MATIYKIENYLINLKAFPQYRQITNAITANLFSSKQKIKQKHLIKRLNKYSSKPFLQKSHRKHKQKKHFYLT